MYKGQAIIYPSMYSLNILLYNKDYKTSNIHRWLSCVDSLLRCWLHWLSRTHWGKDTQRLLPLQARRVLRGLFLSLLGGRDSFSSFCHWMDSHSHLIPLFIFIFWVLKTFFSYVLFVHLIFLSQPNSSFKTMETKFQVSFWSSVCSHVMPM